MRADSTTTEIIQYSFDLLCLKHNEGRKTYVKCVEGSSVCVFGQLDQLCLFFDCDHSKRSQKYRQIKLKVNKKMGEMPKIPIYLIFYM